MMMPSRLMMMYRTRRGYGCVYTVYSLVDQWEEQQVSNPRKSNFSLAYTNQSLSVHSLPKAQTLADSSLEQLPPHLRWSQLACTESRPTLLFSSWNVFYSYQKATAKWRGMGARANGSGHVWINLGPPALGAQSLSHQGGPSSDFWSHRCKAFHSSAFYLFLFPPFVSHYRVWLFCAVSFTLTNLTWFISARYTDAFFSSFIKDPLLNGDVDVENGLVDSVGEGESGMNG